MSPARAPRGGSPRKGARAGKSVAGHSVSGAKRPCVGVRKLADRVHPHHIKPLPCRSLFQARLSRVTGCA
jgi:hypothetical protein